MNLKDTQPPVKNHVHLQVAMDQFESPEARAEGIFRRMDVNSDGKVTRQEFVRCCLEDQKLIDLLTPNVGV